MIHPTYFLDLEPANAGILIEACYTEPSMTRFVKKYWTVLRVGLVVLWVRLLLRGKSLPLVLDRLSPRSMTGRPDEAVMGDLVYYVDRWLQLFPYNKKGNCFPRSLALYWFARRLGYPVLFHCGVRKEVSNLDGHAWLSWTASLFTRRASNGNVSPSPFRILRIRQPAGRRTLPSRVRKTGRRCPDEIFITWSLSP